MKIGVSSTVAVVEVFIDHFWCACCIASIFRLFYGCLRRRMLNFSQSSVCLLSLVLACLFFGELAKLFIDLSFFPCDFQYGSFSLHNLVVKMSNMSIDFSLRYSINCSFESYLLLKVLLPLFKGLFIPSAQETVKGV